MTLIEDLEREIEVKTRDYLFAKSRELIRERGGMLDGQVAYEMAKRQYLPQLIESKRNQYFKEGNFELYHLVNRLFYSKDPAVREAAKKELNDLIAEEEKKIISSSSKT